MKGYTKIFIILSLVLLLSLALTGLASAETIRGKGWLHAEGSGAATLRMSGQVEINGHGVGAVYIYGAESIQAQGDGRRTDLSGGGVLFRGYEGTIIVIGENMRVKMIGAKIDFTTARETPYFLQAGAATMKRPIAPGIE
ncbi:MAG: hypothetical protein U0401_05275 [Anaerolineae bacterium]